MGGTEQRPAPSSVSVRRLLWLASVWAVWLWPLSTWAVAAVQEEATAPVATPAPEPPEEDGGLPEEYQDWVLAARSLLSLAESRAFYALREDYQRDAFIDRFWEERDPYPETARNELRDRFDYWRQAIPEVYGSYQDARGRVLILHGRPSRAIEVRCAKRSTAEIWIYQRTRQIREPFFLVFRTSSDAPATLVGADRTIAGAFGSRACVNGNHLMTAMLHIENNIDEYAALLRRVLARPRPRSEEWLATFQALSTELPEGVELLPVGMSVQFPGRRDSRTVVQALLTVPRDSVVVGDYAGHESLDFQLVGEVVREQRLFESFRYKFGFPLGQVPVGTVPLAFERHLRPGTYELILRVEDLNGHGMARLASRLEVPAVDAILPWENALDPETARLLAEASEAVAAGETRVRIVPPHGHVLAGLVRIDTLALGEQIDRVRFVLDGREVMTKTRPPYNVELDLGNLPRMHELRVEALDRSGSVVAWDERPLNAGNNRFEVRLVEPRAGGQYRGSLQAQAEVQIPDGRSLSYLEVYLDESLVATLYQPPYVLPVVLPPGGAPAYVRVVAYLPDGHSTEDLVFVNAPEYLEQLEVQTVELFTSVVDGRSRPVAGLTRDRFRVFEDGVEQTISRFEWVRDVPIHTGILIDNSASMHESLGEVRAQALQFLTQAITPRDRAAIITFNRFPRLAVALTNDLEILGGGLAGLTAEGGTSLYDSLIFGLYYFTGIRGKRAMLVLSDGKDESSDFSFEEALDFARRAGVTIYSVGFRLDSGQARDRLGTLARETGGRAFFINRPDELNEIYSSIEDELRSQYLVVYQSTNDSEGEAFRNVELRVNQPGVSARTISGYYP